MTASSGRPYVGNIGPLQRRRRRLLGVASGLAGLVLWALLAGTGAPRPWRLGLFLPFFGAAMGFLQAREKT